MKASKILLLASLSLSIGFVYPSGYHFRYHQGQEKFTPSCYKFVSLPSSWSKAMQYCHNDGAHLVTIETIGEDNYLKQIIKRYYRKDHWLGGNDLGHEGDWRWESNHKKLSYQNWYPGEPNNHVGNEHCLELQRNVDFKWNDDNCAHKNPFICEKAC